MRVISIQSGSNGNCYYYESKGTKLLIDAGISFKSLRERTHSVGLNLYDIKGLLISHEHSDHISSAGIFQRKIGMPIFISPKTFNSVGESFGKTENILYFKPNDYLDIGKVKVSTIKTPHDGVEPSIFIIDDGKHKVGIMTDFGLGFPLLKKNLADLDVIFFESNYCQDMLKNNEQYPKFLKERITNGSGHISNIESAELIRDYSSDKLKILALSHLSGQNNTEDLALKTHFDIYKNKNTFQVIVAPRDRPSELIEL